MAACQMTRRQQKTDGQAAENIDMTDAAKPKHHRCPYSLQLLLLLMFLASIGMSWFVVRMQRARRQREAVEAILKVHGAVGYDYQIGASGSMIKGAQPPGPPWLRKLLGDDFFGNVVSAVVHDDSSLKYLKGLTTLQSVSVWDSDVTDAGVEDLNALPSFRVLILGGTEVTDTTLEHLKGLTTLQWLILMNVKVTDAGLEHLKGLTKLQSLSLLNTKVTDEGVQKLRHALPNCKIQIHRRGDGAAANEAGARQVSGCVWRTSIESSNQLDVGFNSRPLPPGRRGRSRPTRTGPALDRRGPSQTRRRRRPHSEFAPTCGGTLGCRSLRGRPRWACPSRSPP